MGRKNEIFKLRNEPPTLYLQLSVWEKVLFFKDSCFFYSSCNPSGLSCYSLFSSRMSSSSYLTSFTASSSTASVFLIWGNVSWSLCVEAQIVLPDGYFSTLKFSTNSGLRIILRHLSSSSISTCVGVSL
mgnify:CR=1 FL=1